LLEGVGCGITVGSEEELLKGITGLLAHPEEMKPAARRAKRLFWIISALLPDMPI